MGHIRNRELLSLSPNLRQKMTIEQGFGLVTKWTHMLGLRVALGILEAGLYPSVVYLLATWYSRCKSANFLPWNLQ